MAVPVHRDISSESMFSFHHILTAVLAYVFFYIFKFTYFILYVWVFIYLRVWVHTLLCVMPDACRGQKRPLDPLELQIQIVLSCQVVLRVEPRSSTRATKVQNGWTISPAPPLVFLVVVTHRMESQTDFNCPSHFGKSIFGALVLISDSNPLGDVLRELTRQRHPVHDHPMAKNKEGEEITSFLQNWKLWVLCLDW